MRFLSLLYIFCRYFYVLGNCCCHVSFPNKNQQPVVYHFLFHRLRAFSLFIPSSTILPFVPLFFPLPSSSYARLPTMHLYFLLHHLPTIRHIPSSSLLAFPCWSSVSQLPCMLSSSPTFLADFHGVRSLLFLFFFCYHCRWSFCHVFSSYSTVGMLSIFISTAIHVDLIYLFPMQLPWLPLTIPTMLLICVFSNHLYVLIFPLTSLPPRVNISSFYCRTLLFLHRTWGHMGYAPFMVIHQCFRFWEKTGCYNFTQLILLSLLISYVGTRTIITFSIYIYIYIWRMCNNLIDVYYHRWWLNVCSSWITNVLIRFRSLPYSTSILKKKLAMIYIATFSWR